MITYSLYLLCLFEVSLCYSFNETNTRKYNENLIPRVYNGLPAKLGDVPYQVSFKKRLWKHRLYASFCGGTIIGPAKLLSAAHCFVHKEKVCDKFCGSSGNLQKKVLSHIFAVAGQLSNVEYRPTNVSIEQGQWRRLKEVRYPPKYSFPKLDFAIVFLRRPFRFNSYVNSIPYASMFINYKGECLVSGFGRISNSYVSDKLLFAYLSLIPVGWCNALHKRNMRSFICTSSRVTDVGKGDSGGPLVCKNTNDPNESSKGILVGIVSGHAYHIGSFFSRVSYYYTYIEKNKAHSESIYSYIHLGFMLHLLYWKFLPF